MNAVSARFSMLQASHSSGGCNHLLAALPVENYKRISPHLELISIPRSDAYSGNADFPPPAIASLHCIMKNGSSVEIAGAGVIHPEGVCHD